MSETIETPKKRKRVAYVSNKELLVELAKMKETGKISNELGTMIIKIATRYATKPNYSGYTYIHEMVADAIFTVILYIHNFNPEKSQNPFAYITQIVDNSFKGFLNREKRISKTKKEMIESHLMDSNRLEKFLTQQTEE